MLLARFERMCEETQSIAYAVAMRGGLTAFIKTCTVIAAALLLLSAV